MERFSRLSFKAKILLYASLVTLFSLFITGVSFISYDIQDAKNNLVENLNMTLDIIETYSATALSLGNREEVSEVIDRLSTNRFLHGAWVFDSKDQLFAAYEQIEYHWPILPTEYVKPGAYFKSDIVVVSKPILFGKNKLGTLVIVSDLSSITLRIMREIAVISIMMVLSFLASILLFQRLQKAVVKSFKNELEYVSHYDALTELPNRNKFMIYLSELTEEAKIQDKHLALLTIGIDRFKIINDTFGHSVGDRLLRAAAKRLERFLDQKNYLARLSGDEFVLILKNVNDYAALKILVQDIIKALICPFCIDEHDILLAASIGISLFPEDAKDAQSMIMHSDVAMFYAKQQGRNSFQFYDAKINEHVLEQHKLENSLHNALENNELIVYYQPKVEIGTHRILGSEALLRWHHPVLGFVSPDKFIPLAEETGLIMSIGLWVLKEACLQNKKWQSQGFSDLKVSVNLSACQFRSSELVEDILKILDAANLDPNSLDLELTESVLIENPERCILMLSVLKKMGISLTVDDFGTGYSSLSYLRRFQIDALKIDKSFIKNVNENSEDAAIVKAILSMSKGLQLRTVAEGVESKAQLDFLSAHGCDEIQGYYYSYPLTRDEFTDLLERSSGILKMA